MHGFLVDCRSIPDPKFPSGRNYYAESWQREHYLAILNHKPGYVPHTYRPLPYGFVRGIEWITGDWWFACIAYRWFFTYWFLWGYYHFASSFLSVARAWLALIPYLLLYPFSVWFYLGQLTDPLSHSLFVLALCYAVEDRWLALACALALGVMTKETVVLMVPAYWACHWRDGWSAFFRAAGLALVCVAAFLAVRLPWGWNFELRSINNTVMLMIKPNLGIGTSPYKGMAPVPQNYIQPLLFVGLFLPSIALHWRYADRRPRNLFIVLVPSLLMVNLCFGWMYESRNYVPLLPLLAILALTPRTNGSSRAKSSSAVPAIAIDC
jgi:hypothetical protein